MTTARVERSKDAMPRALAYLLDGLRSMTPLIVLVVLAHAGLRRRPPEAVWDVVGGLVAAALGIVALTYGLRHAIAPLASDIGESLVAQHGKGGVLAFVCILGVVATIAEPALVTMATEVEALSGNELPSRLFIGVVAAGVGLGAVGGAARILYGATATDFFIPLLATILVLTYFAPERYTALAFDAALATTGPLTVTLVVTLGTALAAAQGRTDILLHGFGLTTLTAIGPMILVLLFGIVVGQRG